MRAVAHCKEQHFLNVYAGQVAYMLCNMQGTCVLCDTSYSFVNNVALGP
jgi:hypothetical protein